MYIAYVYSICVQYMYIVCVYSIYVQLYVSVLLWMCDWTLNSLK